MSELFMSLSWKNGVEKKLRKNQVEETRLKQSCKTSTIDHSVSVNKWLFYVGACDCPSLICEMINGETFINGMR